MLVKSKNHSHFKRKDSVLYEVLSTGEEKPVLFFKQKFAVDVEKLDQTVIDYTNRYIEMFPHLVEWVKDEVKSDANEQLTLF